MAITKEEIKKIAELSRLSLSPDEEVRYAETISAVLDYMKILDEVDTKNVEPLSQVTGLEGVIREDEVRAKSNPKDLLAQMPQVEDEELVVPAVFES
jgi:aspartyl-tRNA(Asn)/glutamyl-tRNA(Gln) amidotransferase subunit C